jgi:hypothetical protein
MAVFKRQAVICSDQHAELHRMNCEHPPSYDLTDVHELTGSKKAVSLKFISDAIACLNSSVIAGTTEEGSRQTAAGLPEKGTLAKASTCGAQ